MYKPIKKTHYKKAQRDGKGTSIGMKSGQSNLEINDKRKNVLTLMINKWGSKNMGPIRRMNYGEEKTSAYEWMTSSRTHGSVPKEINTITKSAVQRNNAVEVGGKTMEANDVIEHLQKHLGTEVDEKKTKTILSNIEQRGFKNLNTLLNYISNRLNESIETDESTESEDILEDDGEVAESSDEEISWRKEDTTADRHKGKGRKRDTKTGLFATDHAFRGWVHNLKQKNQLEKFGVRNRSGGHDNLTKQELSVLEQAYLELPE